MSFTAKKIETRFVTHAIRPERVIVAATGRHEQSRFLTVAVEDAGGVRGYGEAATTPQWNGESAETARWAVEQCFAPQIVGHPFDHPSEALARMDAVSFGNPFAKAALDTALWDLWTRRDGVPATKRFGDREPMARLPTRASIGAYPPAQTVEIARAFWSAGVRTLKFKIGCPGLDDVARLRAVREALGEAPVFTVDANGGYASAQEAVPALEALLPFRPVLIEQPVPRDRLRMLAEVRRRLPVPILADEGVFTPGHLEEALELDAFDYLSVYPGKNGGFTRSLEMARRAQRAGKACTIGSNLETDLGQAAMLALAAACSAFPAGRLAGDFCAALFYPRSSIARPLALHDGCVEVPRGTGFGVEPLAPEI